MKPTRPEAETEYSRGGRAPEGDLGPSPGSAGATARPGPARLTAALGGGGALGAVLLVMAEFMPLLRIHSSASQSVVDTVSTGSHHSYALIPIALLAALLTWAVWRSQSRLALLATGLVGVVALLIALLGDLPDAQATGLIGSETTHFALASSTPAVGLYIETLGAIVLLISAGIGLLLGGSRQSGRGDGRGGRNTPSRASSSPERSLP